MELYKVMLVDDEEEVREAMKRRINWEEIGFTVIATAENGEDAIEKAETEYDKYKIIQDKNYVSDFDKLLIETSKIKNEDNESKISCISVKID